MNKFRTAALAILKEAGKPLHYNDITKLALEQGLLETEGATPEASMGAQLAIDIKRKGAASDFIRTEPGIFALNPNKEVEKAQEQLINAEEELEEEEEEKIEGGYTGKGGEHLVCSEMLFRGFNASIMSVDVGVDIVAIKNNNLSSIQVKTANENKHAIYNFNLRKVSFERHDKNNVYYIFVLAGNGTRNFLILPLSEMEKKVHEKAILEVGQGKLYRIVIKFRNNKIYLGNMDHEMGYYLNNWDIIK